MRVRCEQVVYVVVCAFEGRAPHLATRHSGEPACFIAHRQHREIARALQLVFLRVPPFAKPHCSFEPDFVPAKPFQKPFFSSLASVAPSSSASVARVLRALAPDEHVHTMHGLVLDESDIVREAVPMVSIPPPCPTCGLRLALPTEWDRASATRQTSTWATFRVGRPSAWRCAAKPLADRGVVCGREWAHTPAVASPLLDAVKCTTVRLHHLISSDVLLAHVRASKFAKGGQPTKEAARMLPPGGPPIAALRTVLWHELMWEASIASVMTGATLYHCVICGNAPRACGVDGCFSASRRKRRPRDPRRKLHWQGQPASPMMS